MRFAGLFMSVFLLLLRSEFLQCGRDEWLQAHCAYAVLHVAGLLNVVEELEPVVGGSESFSVAALTQPDELQCEKTADGEIHGLH